MQWEYFYDNSYFNLWAVRKEDDRDLTSQYLFHVVDERSAIALTNYLNSLEEKPIVSEVETKQQKDWAKEMSSITDWSVL